MLFVGDMSITLAKQILEDYVNRLDIVWEDYDDDAWDNQENPCYNKWLLVGRTSEDARTQVELYVDLIDISITVLLPDYEVPLRKHLFKTRQALVSCLLSGKCDALYVVHLWERLQLWVHGKRLLCAMLREDRSGLDRLFQKYPKTDKRK